MSAFRRPKTMESMKVLILSIRSFASMTQTIVSIAFIRLWITVLLRWIALRLRFLKVMIRQ